MLTRAEGREAVHRDIGAALERLGGIDASGWRTGTRLPGWSVADLARHLAYGQELQAGAWERLRTGGADPYDPPTTTATDPSEVVAAIDDHHRRFMAVLDRVGEADLTRPCPMPYGNLPGAVVLQVAVMEAGVHRSDLEHALGVGGEGLAEDTLDAIYTLLPMMLAVWASVATTKPVAGTSVRLAAAGREPISVVAGEETWQPAGGDDWSCTVEGDAAAVALFALGRIDADHPRLAVAGDADLARRFKDHFPGP